MRKTVNWKGKRKLGFFVWQENGAALYVALKGHAEIDRARKVTISEAKRSGNAGWSVDIPTLMKARSIGCKYIVVKLRKRRHFWVTRLEHFLDPSYAKLVTRGKTMSRMIPLRLFVETEQEIRL